MCTVTFIKANNHYLLTSSRDEKVHRSQAILPQVYQHADARLLYPKDSDAGGTWVAMKDNYTAAVLLNGAFEQHQPSPPYRLSRGLILLQLLAAPLPLVEFQDVQLKDIEPFTLVLLYNQRLFECRWDGSQKYQQELNANQPHIWSSATLYDPSIQQQRQKWFKHWQENNVPTLETIMKFHQFAGDGDAENDVRMNRQGYLFTVSITGMDLSETSACMHYLDLKNGALHVHQLPQLALP